MSHNPLINHAGPSRLEGQVYYLDEVRANMAELHLQATEAGPGFRGITPGEYTLEDPCGVLDVIVSENSIETRFSESGSIRGRVTGLLPPTQKLTLAGRIRSWCGSVIGRAA